MNFSPAIEQVVGMQITGLFVSPGAIPAPTKVLLLHCSEITARSVSTRNYFNNTMTAVCAVQPITEIPDNTGAGTVAKFTNKGQIHSPMLWFGSAVNIPSLDILVTDDQRVALTLGVGDRLIVLIRTALLRV